MRKKQIARGRGGVNCTLYIAGGKPKQTLHHLPTRTVGDCTQHTTQRAGAAPNKEQIVCGAARKHTIKYRDGSASIASYGTARRRIYTRKKIDTRDRTAINVNTTHAITDIIVSKRQHNTSATGFKITLWSFVKTPPATSTT